MPASWGARCPAATIIMLAPTAEPLPMVLQIASGCSPTADLRAACLILHFLYWPWRSVILTSLSNCSISSACPDSCYRLTIPFTLWIISLNSSPILIQSHQLSPFTLSDMFASISHSSPSFLNWCRFSCPLWHSVLSPPDITVSLRPGVCSPALPLLLLN